MKKILLWFFALILLIGGTFYLFSSQSYPVASVNNKFISAERLEKSYQAGLSYYQKEASLALSQEEVSKPDFQKELRRASLDKLIEHELIKQLLYDFLGPEEASARVEQRVEEVASTRQENTNQAVKEIFGLDWEGFEDLVIRPEAEREVLALYLEEENIEFLSWFDQRLQSAEIEILIPGFVWQKNEVEISR